MVISQRLNIEFPYDPTILLLGIYQKNSNRDSNKYSYTSAYSIIIHNSQKVETTQVSVSRWMDKQNVI